MLVNNAGMLETQMRVEQMDAGRLSRVFATNVTGSFLCCREAVRRMSPRHGGSVWVHRGELYVGAGNAMTDRWHADVWKVALDQASLNP